MRALIQRVREAEVVTDGEKVASIERGILVFLGVKKGDAENNADYLAEKIARLRIFEDQGGKLNLSLMDVSGGLLVVSQFTLVCDARHGRRPSFTEAADPETAEALYLRFVKSAEKFIPRVEKGRFRAAMAVRLVNDGPLTLMLEDPPG
ncbi:MAG: D-tyrosyl-tRNA(Tyr) deacylase [Deltaproteobacteria bacterium]|jgi:D-tyrosyl-tRNA(Tyr) deacylase|nr:D-tyrosyl-tRNA(Tyr) deacylase [Deltaproteobacteria bacterium]